MEPLNDSVDSRRNFLRAGVTLTGASLWSGGTLLAQERSGEGRGRRDDDDDEREEHEEREERAEHEEHEDHEEEISPAEDLMREHGVLKRIMLVYDECAQRLRTVGAEVPAEALHTSARLIRTFIEDYHEKLEENFLFPRFRQANTLVELVDTLAAQHQAGRRLTDRVLRLVTNTALKEDANRRQLATWLRQFNRMYAPHEAREDTVLFPALRRIVSANEYDALGEDFEKKEHQLFGEDGFGEIVDKVAAVEKKLGIYDLAQFTPKV